MDEEQRNRKYYTEEKASTQVAPEQGIVPGTK